jgi:hypothetical protein
MKFSRISLINVTDHDDKFVLDMALDEKGRPVAGQTYFGCHGSISKNAEGHNKFPLLLRNDGKFDYGSGYEKKYRHGETNILSKVIVIGEYATFSYYDDYAPVTGTYRIKRVVDLIEAISIG